MSDRSIFQKYMGMLDRGNDRLERLFSHVSTARRKRPSQQTTEKWQNVTLALTLFCVVVGLGSAVYQWFWNGEHGLAIFFVLIAVFVFVVFNAALISFRAQRAAARHQDEAGRTTEQQGDSK